MVRGALTGGVLPSHVLGAGGLALLYAQVGDVEGRDVHVVRAVQVSQGPVPLGTGEGNVVQF